MSGALSVDVLDAKLDENGTSFREVSGVWVVRPRPCKLWQCPQCVDMTNCHTTSRPGCPSLPAGRCGSWLRWRQPRRHPGNQQDPSWRGRLFRGASHRAGASAGAGVRELVVVRGPGWVMPAGWAGRVCCHATLRTKTQLNSVRCWLPHACTRAAQTCRRARTLASSPPSQHRQHWR
jgi:hypothetical protein